jgi:hypothetical protein
MFILSAFQYILLLSSSMSTNNYVIISGLEFLKLKKTRLLHIAHSARIKHSYRLTIYSAVVIMCTSMFNSQGFCIFQPSLYITYDSRKTTAIVVQFNINRFVFLMQAHTAICEIQTTSLYCL